MHGKIFLNNSYNKKQNKTGKANTYYQKIVDKYSGKEAATTAKEALNKQNKQN